LLEEIVHAAAANDSAREAGLIHGFLLPKNSTWFTDEYGPGFGASLAAAYRRVQPDLEEEIKRIYDGDAERGWLTATIRRYVDPDTEHAPHRFLNCMEHIVPLYQAAFKDGNLYYSQKPGENGKQVAGDPSGYFIYYQGGFRFIPTNVLQKLPKKRPVRIRLDLDVMESKVVTKMPVKAPLEAIKKRISGQVVVQLILDVGGNIKELKVLEGNPILSAAVMDAVKQWRFAPTTLDGDPVEVDLEIPMGFDLSLR
jgi:TonB family protein